MKTFADAAMLAILVLYAISGFRRGFIRSLIDLVGGIAALIAAVLFAKSFAAWVQGVWGPSAPKWVSDPVLSKVAAILVLFLLFEALVETVSALLNHLFSLPGLRQINALFGGAIGFGKGSVVVLILCAALRSYLPSGTAAAAIPSQPQQELRQAAFSQIYQAVSGHNPVYDLFQSQIWNEVGSDAKKAV